MINPHVPLSAEYNGSRCEEEQDDCMTADCSKNGMCQDGIATFTCLCKDGYQGDKYVTHVSYKILIELRNFDYNY